ncbi:MAG TPA: glycosyltransferase family 4 protein [Terriglobales bacterium]|nr:glycosyltransferase family 4 protein [Terriglobales bacterium]
MYGSHTRVIHAGVDADLFQERAEQGRQLRSSLGIPQEAFVILWLGVLEPFRRLEDMLEAARGMRKRGEPVHCLIVGRTDFAPGYAQGLQQLVDRQDLKRQVTFVSRAVPESLLADYYCAADVFVFPNDHQSWGLAPLEALCCNRPVVVSRGSGVSEVLRDGETALLVPPRCPHALAAAIARLKNDARLRQHISREGRRLVMEQLSWNTYVERMSELLAEVAEQRHRQPANTPLPGHWLGRLAEVSEPVWRVR